MGVNFEKLLRFSIYIDAAPRSTSGNKLLFVVFCLKNNHKFGSLFRKNLHLFVQLEILLL